MTVKSGSHPIGPENGQLGVSTFGDCAILGHHAPGLWRPTTDRGETLSCWAQTARPGVVRPHPPLRLHVTWGTSPHPLGTGPTPRSSASIGTARSGKRPQGRRAMPAPPALSDTGDAMFVDGTML